jgi:hypothetical protein
VRDEEIVGVRPASAIVLVAGARAISVQTAMSSLLRDHPGLPRLRRGSHLVVRGVRHRRSVISSGPANSHPTGLGWARVRGRMEAVIADPLLDRLTLVAARVVPADDVYYSLPFQLIGGCDRLVLVSDGRRPYEEAELELLRAASNRCLPVVLAVTHTDESALWPEVVLANQARLARSVPDLAFHPWHPVGAARSDLRDGLDAATSVRMQ